MALALVYCVRKRFHTKFEMRHVTKMKYMQYYLFALRIQVLSSFLKLRGILQESSKHGMVSRSSGAFSDPLILVTPSHGVQRANYASQKLTLRRHWSWSHHANKRLILTEASRLS